MLETGRKGRVERLKGVVQIETLERKLVGWKQETWKPMLFW